MILPPVIRLYAPEELRTLAKRALAIGFSHVDSGPLDRSSYHAGAYHGHLHSSSAVAGGARIASVIKEN